MDTSSLPGNGGKIKAFAARLLHLSREGSLSCQTCCNSLDLFGLFRSTRKEHVYILRNYSNCSLNAVFFNFVKKAFNV